MILPADRIHPLGSGFQAFKKLDHLTVLTISADRRFQIQETPVKRAVVSGGFITIMSIYDRPLRATIFVAQPNNNQRGP